MSLEIDSTNRQAFQFNGNAKEYFGIWIVNLGLTIVTLGIYSAWAKVRNNQYFYRNTKVAESTFDYTADPRKILKGRAIAVVMLIGYQLCAYFSPNISIYVLVALLLLVPLIYQSSIAFRMRYSQWRNINFRFRRNTLKMYALFSPILIYLLVVLGGPLLFGVSPEEIAASEESGEVSEEFSNYLIYSGVVVGLGGLFFPFWQSLYYNFVGSRTSLGSSSFSIALKARSFYGIYLATAGFGMLWGIATVVLSGYFFRMDPEAEDLSLSSFMLIYFLLIIFYLFAYAFIKTALTNLIYSAIRLEGVEFTSTLKFWRVAWLYVSNTFAILLTVGMAIPWAKIRLARYRAENMHVISSGDTNIKSMFEDEVDASADAMSDLFDFDIGL